MIIFLVTNTGAVSYLPDFLAKEFPVIAVIIGAVYLVYRLIMRILEQVNEPIRKQAELFTEALEKNQTAFSETHRQTMSTLDQFSEKVATELRHVGSLTERTLTMNEVTARLLAMDADKRTADIIESVVSQITKKYDTVGQ